MRKLPTSTIAILFCVAIPIAISAVGDAESPPNTHPTLSPMNIASPGSFPILPNQFELKALVAANDPAYLHSLDTTHMEELTNVRVVNEFVPLSDFSSALAKRLTSGALPDIIHYPFPVENWSTGPLIDQGIAKPIDSSIDRRTLWYAKFLQDSEALRTVVTNPAGKMYMMPTILSANQAKNEYEASASWAINRNWLDNLGLPVPTYPTELLEALTAFRDLDANANGDPSDEIPLAIFPTNYSAPTFSDRALTSSYANVARLLGSRWTLDPSGTVAPIFVREEYRDGLRFLRQACVDGLISTDTTTDHLATRDGLRDSKVGLIPSRLDDCMSS